jgi:hypothetical protein
VSFWKDILESVISKIEFNRVLESTEERLLQRMDISALAEGYSPSLWQPLTVNVQFIFLFPIFVFQESAWLKG